LFVKPTFRHVSFGKRMINLSNPDCWDLLFLKQYIRSVKYLNEVVKNQLGAGYDKFEKLEELCKPKDVVKVAFEPLTEHKMLIPKVIEIRTLKY